MKKVLCTLAIALMVTPAFAQPTLDGSISGDGYNLAATQSTQTQFGDNGSELNAAWAQIDSGVLYLTLTGNLENNFNKLNIFIDSGLGGQTTLQADANNGGNNPENDNWANQHNGFTFDSNFDANYMIIVRNGNFGGDRFDIDFATVGGGLGAFETASDVFGGSLTGSNANALPGAGIGVAFDNSNGAGIAGGTGAADPNAAEDVLTGIELAIPLSSIGNPSISDLRISPMVNGSNHDFLSNQILSGFQPPQGNLGGDGAGNFTGSVQGINLNNFAGNQWFNIPEPATLALAGLALCGMLSTRRRD